ncbi:hypothetical protein HAX54_038671, partial [Datura stramonium]|nr:hypothetical protein [Datura stramonium]
VLIEAPLEQHTEAHDVPLDRRRDDHDTQVIPRPGVCVAGNEEIDVLIKVERFIFPPVDLGQN